jgi:hypothetical protein
MKKALLTILSILALTGFSQEEKTWRLGLQIGNQTTHSRFSGGMSDANARFHNNVFGAGAFNIIGRYDHNRHWMFTSGLGFSSLGFEYTIAENYSLLGRAKNQGQYTRVRSQFGIVEIPAMIFYKFNPNCKNVRWLVGAGLAQTFIGGQSAEESVSKANDGSSNVNYLSSSSKTIGGNYLFLRWSVAREKMYKRGGILNVSLLLNMGFSNIAQSTVNYTIDNQNYNHSFTSNGNFAGLRLAYFFRPLNALQNAKKAAITK